MQLSPFNMVSQLFSDFNEQEADGTMHVVVQTFASARYHKTRCLIPWRSQRRSMDSHNEQNINGLL